MKEICIYFIEEYEKKWCKEEANFVYNIFLI